MPAGAPPVTAYRPVKFGGRRSAVAATPSRKSSVRAQRCCSSCSRAVAALHPVGEVAAHGLADREHRERSRRPRSRRRTRAPRRAARRPATTRSASPMRERLLALHVPAGVHQLERALLADDRRERHRDAEALVEAEPGEVAAEAGLGLTRRGSRPRARGRARRPPRRPAPRRRSACGSRRGAPPARRGRRCWSRRSLRAEVGAGAEVLALRAQHDHPALGVVVEAEHRRRRAASISAMSNQLCGRPVDLHGRDVVVELDGDGVALIAADATRVSGACPVACRRAPWRSATERT